ncbi:MAG TPA: hypothetical protein VGY57_07050, partial [Vicinamibacterales bacterium]|nr:hypothetical protein [Vicinamibacterales bacterium]
MAMICPQCGTSRPTAGSSALDLCPACLLAAALSTVGAPCPYQIVGPIAESARGTTYLAQPSGRARGCVALKIFAPRDDVDDILARYERWKPALAKVRHSHVARMLDAGLTDEGLLYVASPFVAGWPLSSIDGRQAIGQDVRNEIARQLAAAVAAIHDAGLAHLALDSSHVRVSTTSGVHASLLGLGIRLIIDGDEPSPQADQD